MVHESTGEYISVEGWKHFYSGEKPRSLGRILDFRDIYVWVAVPAYGGMAGRVVVDNEPKGVEGNDWIGLDWTCGICNGKAAEVCSSYVCKSC